MNNKKYSAGTNTPKPSGFRPGLAGLLLLGGAGAYFYFNNMNRPAVHTLSDGK